MPSRRFPYALSHVIGWVGQPCVVIRRRCSDSSFRFACPLYELPRRTARTRSSDAARLLNSFVGADIDAAGGGVSLRIDRNVAAGGGPAWSRDGLETAHRIASEVSRTSAGKAAGFLGRQKAGGAHWKEAQLIPTIS